MVPFATISQRRPPALLVCALLACAALLAVRGPQLLDPRVLGVADFVEYWSAGRLNLNGENPYAAEPLLRLQQAAGWDESRPIPMWNPFWTLALVMPLSALPFGIARLLWLLVQGGIVIGCADFLWRYYQGASALRWLAWVVALSFCPTLIVLHMGQMGPFLLLGLCLFLRFIDRPGGWIAGAALVLASVKPHLLLLFWVALGLWVVRQRRWQIGLGAGVALLLTAGATLATNRGLLSEYREALSGRLTSDTLDYLAPTPGAFLRWIAGEPMAWVQYLPTLLGLAGVVLYWQRHRASWEWRNELPVVLLASYATALYGWLGDQVVLLIPVIQCAVWAVRGCELRAVRLAIVVYVILDVLILATKVAGVSEASQFWVAPSLFIGYLLLRGRPAMHRSGPCSCVGAHCPGLLHAAGG